MKRFLSVILVSVILFSASLHAGKESCREECGDADSTPFELNKKTKICCNKEPRPLNILLTYDGNDLTRFGKMREALMNAGHTVCSYIPAFDATGLSGAVTSDVLHPVQSNDVTTINNDPAAVAGFDFPGTPVECVQFGRRNALFTKGLNFTFDLVVSGINADTYSHGSFSFIAGGIGGALVATLNSTTNFPNLPAIAVSAGKDASEERVEEAAQFVVSLIRRLDECRDDNDRLLPDNTGLSVNVPGAIVGSDPLVDQPIIGVSMNRTGRYVTQNNITQVTLEATSGNRVETQVVPDLGNVPEDIPYSDDVDLRKGFITIVPFQADFTASTSVIRQVCKKLDGAILTKRPCEEDFCKNLRCLSKLYQDGNCPGGLCKRRTCNR